MIQNNKNTKKWIRKGRIIIQEHYGKIFYSDSRHGFHFVAPIRLNKLVVLLTSYYYSTILLTASAEKIFQRQWPFWPSSKHCHPISLFLLKFFLLRRKSKVWLGAYLVIRTLHNSKSQYIRQNQWDGINNIT